MAATLIAALALAQGAAPPANEALPPWEERLGWQLLFDGETLAGWHAFGRPGVLPQGWSVDAGAIHCAAGAGGGDLVSDRVFEDFELELEWKVAAGANSGIKYRFRDDPAIGAVLGPEYQILDDDGHADGAKPETSAAALYALYPAREKLLGPAGEWNRARIVSRGERLEHWLNGARVLVAEVGSADWEARRSASKFAASPRFGRFVPAPIALQDHGDAVWFRDLRIRDPSHPPGTPVTLFDGETLAGWRLVGEGDFRVEERSIVGQWKRDPAPAQAPGKAFLVTERAFADFVLEVEVQAEGRGNSGIQVRSRVEDAGTFAGYQIEIDPSERSWSGGLFLEGGDWIQTLERDAQARAAFRPLEWNLFRIECSGPVIRAWVNGIPTCDFRQASPAAGVIGLQVHDPDTHVRWRDLHLWELR